MFSLFVGEYKMWDSHCEDCKTIFTMSENRQKKGP